MFNFATLSYANILGRIEHVFDFIDESKILIGLGRHKGEILNDFNVIDFYLKCTFKV